MPMCVGRVGVGFGLAAGLLASAALAERAQAQQVK